MEVIFSSHKSYVYSTRKVFVFLLLPPVKKRYYGVIGALYSIVKLVYCGDGFRMGALGFVTENR